MKCSARRWTAFALLGFMCAHAQAAVGVEPCKLLTADEVGKALGGPISATTPLGTTACIWASGAHRVNIVLRDAAAWARLTMPIQGINKTPISGIGDAAQVSDAGKEDAMTLSAKKGERVIVLTVSGLNDRERERSVAESLAKGALARL